MKICENRYNLSMKFILLSLLGILVGAQAFALDISLAGETRGGSGGGKIGVVDMQKIYQLAPRTLNAKEDYMKRLQDKKDYLTKKEKDLESIKNQIAVLETTMKSAPDATSTNPLTSTTTINTSTGSAITPPVTSTSLSDLKQQLETKQSEYQDARKQATEDLAAFEKNQNQVIFGDIYKALKDVAEEEQVSIIVDKSSVLFGATEIDLTEKLQARVRGF